ncbi:N-formylglutamate amidohydrolase [Oligoflexus tunisiensis]|uniref:N-formylglutamate amidohydrolase n=1 Tax=Oligoflexus tunisiensis TaxID=708132 RepID=UPI00114CCD69|nr:N-formylglutamate amidohydrolase [Oligoflexus tunisiensis]
MTYQSLKETTYAAGGPTRVLLISPHGADAKDFLDAFPAIESDALLQAVWPLFETYLAIERDVGADELAHAIAHNLARRYDIPCQVICVNYPRAIIDGGRLMDHCLRACLPTALFVELKERFLELHQQTLRRVDELYASIRSGAARYLIDVHTMASFCPIDGNGTRYILPVSFHRLEDYVNQFVEARDHKYRRSIDLITGDDHGQRWADPRLVAEVQRALQAEGYPVVENFPYCASAAFLSGQHVRSVPSISLDVPKHLLSSWAEDFTDYQLDDVPLSPERIERLARCLAGAIHAAMS